MALPPILEDRLRIPVIAAPLFIISHPPLVLAQCKAGIEVDRKVLSDIAIHEPEAFTALCDKARAALDYLKDNNPNAFERATGAERIAA